MYSTICNGREYVKAATEASCAKLGVLYAKGDRVPLKFREGVALLTRACKMGDDNGCGVSGRIVRADGSAAGGSSGGGGGSGGAAGAGGDTVADGGSARDPPDPIVQLEEMQTLLADGNALGLRYFPDEGTCALVRRLTARNVCAWTIS